MVHEILPTQKPKRSRLRRLTLAGVAPLATLALIAGTAPAANAADVGVIVNTKNGSNAKVRNAPSTEADVVNVFRNGTRLPDAECRVRTADTSVWVKLAGERYIRADLTGFDTRLPECSTKPEMPRTPDSVDRPQGAYRGPNEYEYNYTFLIGPKDPRETGVTPEVATARILANFDEGFEFQGCGVSVWAGKQCELRLVPGISFNVQFDRTWSTGWEFTSLEGTEEGPYRWIKFEFRYNAAGDRLLLDIAAKGPRSAWLTSEEGQPLNFVLTLNSWRVFADRVAKQNDLCQDLPWWSLNLSSAPMCATYE